MLPSFLLFFKMKFGKMNTVLWGMGFVSSWWLVFSPPLPRPWAGGFAISQIRVEERHRRGDGTWPKRPVWELRIKPATSSLHPPHSRLASTAQQTGRLLKWVGGREDVWHGGENGGLVYRHESSPGCASGDFCDLELPFSYWRTWVFSLYTTASWGGFEHKEQCM